MSTIANRLRASVRMDAINGNAEERAICSRQMLEAAEKIDDLWKEVLRLRPSEPATPTSAPYVTCLYCDKHIPVTSSSLAASAWHRDECEAFANELVRSWVDNGDAK